MASYSLTFRPPGMPIEHNCGLTSIGGSVLMTCSDGMIQEARRDHALLVALRKALKGLERCPAIER
jgi:hypothetical protein